MLKISKIDWVRPKNCIFFFKFLTDMIDNIISFKNDNENYKMIIGEH